MGGGSLEMTMHPFFTRRVVVDDSTECWNWIGSVNSWGYGRTITSQSTERASHRISWVLHFGEIPDGQCVLHRCDNPRCCNPTHLFLGTVRDNVRDMVAKGRNNPRRGESNPNAKLTRSMATQIRRLADVMTVTQLARAYRVSRRAISFVIGGVTWK